MTLNQPCDDSHEVSILTLADAPVRAMVLPASAIVSCSTCFPRSADRIAIDLEGDKYHRGSTVFDKLVHATGRHMRRYPTIARLTVAPAQTVEVGFYRPSSGTVFIEDPVAFEQWYGVPADELVNRARLDTLEKSLRTLARRPPRSAGEMMAYQRDTAEYRDLTARLAASAS